MMTGINQFDADKYKHIISTADKKSNQGFMVYSNKPKIAGTFSGWRSREMMTIQKFWELIQRNNMPPVRYYVEDNGTIYNRLAQALSNDIYRIIKRKYCGKNNQLPVLHKIMKKKELKEKITIEKAMKYEHKANQKLIASKDGSSGGIK